MAIIKPYGKKIRQEKWFFLRQPRLGDVDIAAQFFGVKGEFSPERDMAFEKHIKRINYFNSLPFFQKMNGRRIKELVKKEKPWY